MIMLGVPAFGLTFAVTILTIYLPIILNNLVNPVLIGTIIGAEGVFGLFLPFIFGVLSDRERTVAGRWKYLTPATVAMIASLVLMGLFRNVAIIVPMVAVFYMGYFAYLAPYWATYPDLIKKEYSGRSRSAEGTWRVLGAFVALLSGGFLLTVWTPLPFVMGAGLVGLVTFIFGLTLKGHIHKKIPRHIESFGESFKYIQKIMRSNSDIRNLVIANTFWNATLQSIQAFVVLFFTEGLHRSEHFVSGVIFPIASIGILIMAPLAGKLADKYGHIRILLIACIIYGIGDTLPAFTQSYWVIAVVPLVSAAAAAIMTLPYSAMMRLMGNDRHGALSGLFGISRGLGTFLGPVISGAAVALGRSVFAATDGWGGFWFMAGLFILISLFFLLRIREPQLEPVKLGLAELKT